MAKEEIEKNHREEAAVLYLDALHVLRRKVDYKPGQAAGELEKRLRDRAREAAKSAFNDYVEKKDYEQALRVAEFFGLEENREKLRDVATKAVRKLVLNDWEGRYIDEEDEEDARVTRKLNREKAIDLVNRYDIEDEDVLEELTKPK